MTDRLTETFLDLVRIDSPTGYEGAVARFIASALTAAGCDVRFDGTQAETGADTGNLIAVLPATGSGKTVAFSAHMDCVAPCSGVEPVVRDGVVYSAGDTVLGGDDKSGVAAIIELVRRLSEGGEPYPEVHVVLTVAEENGLLGAKALDPADCTADLCLVLDAAGDVGGIVTAAPTHYTFRAVFSGRSAHAGVEPERGVSAVAMAAHAIASMELGRLDAETTANIGTVRGGSATNVVAPACEVTGECRSLDHERAGAVRDAMEAALHAAADEFGGSVEVTWKLEYEGFCFDDDSPEIALVSAACADIGVTPRLFKTGGGSDGNILSAKGAPTLVLSSGMTDVHSPDESLDLRQLALLVDLLGAIVLRAAV
ncbi:MAG: M20/M25/M40 family metallo-hydrolase [Coriobacteriia bacterium]|nr:M20/M25/M40 family metallo-hydrolase [Coriobacteriia bacterium]